MANTDKNAVATANQGGAVAAKDFITYKNQLTQSVLNRLAELTKGGITVPPGYNASQEIYLGFLTLTAMTTREGRPLLSAVTPQSVANAMLEMSLKGLSLYKKQCNFIQHGDRVDLQTQYHGNVALAKRYGAGEPQAQVIYEGDEFEYEVNPKTGKKVILKHNQKLGNINNDKIVGAWCLIPYANDPDADPKIEVMTMDEIRTSWMQGPTKGQSPAHLKFPGEMAKKTVISRAAKLFFTTSSDDGTMEPAEYQEAVVVDNRANAVEAEFTNLPPAPSAEAVNTDTGEVIDLKAAPAAPAPEPAPARRPVPQPVKVPDDMPDEFNPEA